MEAILEKKEDTYKMSIEERENITNQLDEAFKLNAKKPQTRLWDSKEYRKKYAL